MRVFIEDSIDYYYFRICDFAPKYEPVLKMCFYQQDEKGYYKKYSKNAPYIKQCKTRFVEKGEAMLNQLGYFSPIPWQRALKEFCQTVKDKKINWWLVGSCAACIQGVNLKPHDIDIMIDSADVDIVADLFANYLIEPILNTNGWVTKDFGVIFTTARIDIASDPSETLDNPAPVDCGPYAKQHLVTVQWKGFKIKVPPLELYLNANKIRKRFDRVKLINQMLHKEESWLKK